MKIIKKVYYEICKLIAKVIFPKRKMVYEVLPDSEETSIYCCNHSGAIGPTNMTLWFDRPQRTWIISYIFDKEVSTNFVFHDFLYARGRKCKWFWRGLAAVTAFFVRPMLEMQNAIKVYKASARARETFDDTVNALKEGNNVVIFPESPTKFSEYINDFYDGFAQVGKYYYDATGKCLKFYPTYVGAHLKTINVGKPIVYDPTKSPKENRQEIANYLRDSIDTIARNLPKHKPVPFLTEDYYKAYGEYVECPEKYWEVVNQHHSD